MAGPNELLAWLQSLAPSGPGPGNVGPVNGFLPDPTQTPPNPPLVQFGGFHPENILQGHAGASLGRFSPNFPVNSAQFGGDTGGVDQSSAPVAATPPAQPSAPFVQPQHPSTMRYPMWATQPAPSPAGSPPATYPPPEARPSTVPPPAGPLATPYDPLSSIRAPTAPMKRRAGAANLGYYQPTTGNARGATWTPYTNPQDPRIYRG